jgi:hypothetical protein
MIAPLKISEIESGTAESLKNELLKILIDLDLPIKNCVCISTDGPSVMVGRLRGFHRLMNETAPNLLDTGRCNLHVIANGVRAACDELGGSAEHLADNIYSYFHYASRWTRYKDVQRVLELESHRPLRRVETRWLQLLPVVSRLIEQYPALEEYFLHVLPAEKGTEMRNPKVKDIVSSLKQRAALIDLHFLKSVLPELDRLEKRFEKNAVMIHTLYSDIRKLFRDLLSKFLQTDHVNKHSCNLKTISFDSEFWLPDSEIFIGESTKNILRDFSLVEKQSFFVRVRAFYKELASYLQRMLPLSSSILRDLKFLRPSQQKESSAAVCAIGRAMGLSDDDLSKLDSEWRSFSVDAFISQIVDHCDDTDISQFWFDIQDMKDISSDVAKYATLCRVAFGAMTIPCGNAAVERVFSDLCDLLTKKRNRLQELTIDSCIVSSGYMKATSLTCLSFPLTDFYITSGFNARAAYKAQLRKEKEESDKKEKDLKNRQQIHQQIELEMQRNKKQALLKKKEEELEHEKAELNAEKNTAEILLEQYRKKVAAVKEREKALEKATQKVLKRKADNAERVTNLAIAKAAKRI